MEEQKFIDGLMNSRKLKNSLVAFLAELLRDFFSGELDEATFKQEFTTGSIRAKTYLIYMSNDDREANQTIFENEFELTDTINHAIHRDNLSGQEFKDRLWECIVNYNKKL